MFGVKTVEGKVFIQIVLGSLVRFGLMKSHFQRVIASRIELSTPLNSWKRGIRSHYSPKDFINSYSFSSRRCLFNEQWNGPDDR